jgi:hypothetical protein
MNTRGIFRSGLAGERAFRCRLAGVLRFGRLAIDANQDISFRRKTPLLGGEQRGVGFVHRL